MGAKKLKEYGEIDGEIVEIRDSYHSFKGELVTRIKMVRGGPIATVPNKFIKILKNQRVARLLYGK